MGAAAALLLNRTALCNSCVGKGHMLLIEGRGLVEHLAAINVSKDTKTVTLNDALLDRPEGIVVSHAPAAAAYVTHRRRRAVLYNDINQHIC